MTEHRTFFFVVGGYEEYDRARGPPRRDSAEVTLSKRGTAIWIGAKVVRSGSGLGSRCGFRRLMSGTLQCPAAAYPVSGVGRTDHCYVHTYAKGFVSVTEYCLIARRTGLLLQPGTSWEGVGGAHHPPTPQTPPSLKNWAKFSSGYSPNQKISLPPSAPIS